MSERIVAAFHSPRMGEEEGHPVQVVVQIPGSNQVNTTYLSRPEAVALYRSLERYLHEHAATVEGDDRG